MSDHAALYDRIASLERERDAYKGQVGALQRILPLCPDHRDKQHGKDCLACQIEAAEASLSTLHQQIEALREKWKDRESRLIRRGMAQPQTEYAMRLEAQADGIQECLRDLDTIPAAHLSSQGAKA